MSGQLPHQCRTPGLWPVMNPSSASHVGRSPSSSSSSSLGSGVRSPGQGLRLGLSRRVRVKPLHPSMTSH
ncbi:hypothetical protein CRUP_017746 [Coryphaenoides rupestris]|nr:hypothetical protein CRUP_017746 [Coryphaenoides rupestris]